jgi:lipopolysaccharide transport system permease protein
MDSQSIEIKSANSPEVLKPFIIIKPRTGLFDIDFQELWQYRDLFYFLILREVKLRYKQTVLGVAWAVIQPFFTMIAFTLLFNKAGKLPTNGIPAELFQYTGLLAWSFFQQTLTLTSNSFLTNVSLVTKVYCPRLMLPVSVVMAGMVDFAIASSFLFILMPYYQWAPPIQIFLLPLFVFLLLLVLCGSGFWLSSLIVKYRDFRYIVTFLVQFLMVCSPVAYPASMLPESWRIWYGLNPMTGAIEGFRWSILGQGMASWPMIAVSVFSALALFVSGMLYFRNTEKYFADLI